MTTQLLGISGSLRARSYNTALLRACVDLLPDGAQLEVFDISAVPLYNGDLDNDTARPEAVSTLQRRITESDGLLLAMPEYNYGVSGVLKNILDWASRPAFGSPLTNKPVGIMGASPGGSGTMRGQEQLKLNLMATLARPFPHPGVAVGRCKGRFNEDLQLTDASTREFLSSYLRGFLGWINQLNR